MKMEKISLVEYDIPAVSLNLQRDSPHPEQAWQALQAFIRTNYNEECVCLYDENCPVLPKKDQKIVLQRLLESVDFHTKLFLPAACELGQIILIDENFLWIEAFRYAPLIFLLNPIYDDILNEKFTDDCGIAERLNMITSQKISMYPFIHTLLHASKYKSEEAEERIAVLKKVKALFR